MLSTSRSRACSCISCSSACRAGSARVFEAPACSARGARVTSALDRWNPLTPLAAAVAMVLAAFAGPQPYAPLLVLAIALLVAIAADIGRKVTALTMLVVLPTFALLVLLDAAFPDAATAQRRWIPSRAGVLDALAISLRLGAAIAALGVIVVGVAPRRLTRALAARGLPAWAAYLVIASLEAVPDARRRADDVLDAQRCRGVAIGKGTGVRGRLRALPALAGPLIVGLVTESRGARARARCARVRSARTRTALAPIADPAAEQWARRVIWLALAAVIAWRLWEFAHSLVIARERRARSRCRMRVRTIAVRWSRARCAMWRSTSRAERSSESRDTWAPGRARSHSPPPGCSGARCPQRSMGRSCTRSAAARRRHSSSRIRRRSSRSSAKPWRKKSRSVPRIRRSTRPPFARAWTTRSRRRSATRSRRAFRVSSRAASCSASRSPRRSRSTRRCSCSTSPPRSSIPRRRAVRTRAARVARQRSGRSSSSSRISSCSRRSRIA